MRTKITKRVIDALEPGALVADTEIRGFVARRLASGTITYGYRLRNRAGKQRWLGLGLHGSITPDQARELAKKRAGEVADGRDPAAERVDARAAETNTVNHVLDNFVARYVRKEAALRSAGEIERSFDTYVRPRIGTRSIYTLSRADMIELLDAIEDNHGAVMADRTLAYVRKAFNWWATRDEKFTPPIIRGMARTKPRERARSRILDDQEIRDVWAALEDLPTAPACFPRFVRSLLITVQRRTDVSHMASTEIDEATWIIPGARYKTKMDHAVPLTADALRLIGDERNGFIFSSDGGKRPFRGYSKAKRALDKKIAELRKQEGRDPMPHWTLHDLRRTGRSLMSRAGVVSDIAERVLGHVLAGVRGTYDRYLYQQEKRDALEKLARLVERILHPNDAVVPFPAGARRQPKTSRRKSA